MNDPTNKFSSTLHSVALHNVHRFTSRNLKLFQTLIAQQQGSRYYKTFLSMDAALSRFFQNNFRLFFLIFSTLQQMWVGWHSTLMPFELLDHLSSPMTSRPWLPTRFRATCSRCKLNNLKNEKNIFKIYLKGGGDHQSHTRSIQQFQSYFYFDFHFPGTRATAPLLQFSSSSSRSRSSSLWCE